MRHGSEIRLNNSVSLLFSMFCSHDQAFEKYQMELLHCNYLMFFLVCRNCQRKKKLLSSTCTELAIISYFGKCEYNYCFNMLQKHDNNILKECQPFVICSNSFILYWKKTFQEILYTAMLDYLLRYIMSKSGRKLVLGATVVYSRDLNLRTHYFSIVSLRLYA